MIIDWVLFWAILFIWLNSIDCVFVLANWNVHIVGMFSLRRTAQGTTNAPHPRLAHIYFCRMDKSIGGTLDLPNVCFSSLSRRGDWLIDVSVEQFFIRTCFEVVVPVESEITWDSGYFQRIYWEMEFDGLVFATLRAASHLHGIFGIKFTAIYSS